MIRTLAILTLTLFQGTGGPVAQCVSGPPLCQVQNGGPAISPKPVGVMVQNGPPLARERTPMLFVGAWEAPGIDGRMWMRLDGDTIARFRFEDWRSPTGFRDVQARYRITEDGRILFRFRDWGMGAVGRIDRDGGVRLVFRVPGSIYGATGKLYPASGARS